MTKINLGFSGSLDKDYEDVRPSYFDAVTLQRTSCDVSSPSLILLDISKSSSQRIDTPEHLEELRHKSRTRRCIAMTSSRFFNNTCFEIRSWQRRHFSEPRLAQKSFLSIATLDRDDALPQTIKTASINRNVTSEMKRQPFCVTVAPFCITFRGGHEYQLRAEPRLSNRPNFDNRIFHKEFIMPCAVRNRLPPPLPPPLTRKCLLVFALFQNWVLKLRFGIKSFVSAA